MMHTAGFAAVERLGRFQLKARAGWSVRHAAFRATV